MMTATFPKSVHLRSGAEFAHVYDQKCKAADGVLLLFAARRETSLPVQERIGAVGPQGSVGQPNEDSSSASTRTRIGLSVGKKHGNAVVRNRIKRLLREAFRLEQQQIPGGLDLIAIPLAADKASLNVYRESLVRLALKLSKRLSVASRPSVVQERPASIATKDSP